VTTRGHSSLRLAGAMLLGIFLVALAVVWVALPVREWAQTLIASIRELGAAGVAIYALAYIVLVVLLAPAEVMTIAAGLIYGAWAFPLVVVSATAGAALAFLVSRYLARDTVLRLVERRPSLQAVDKAIEEEGWKVVMLLRLNPLVPFNLQNYFFGATRMDFVPYAVATFFGIMPGTAAYVYIGTLGRVATGPGVGTVKIAFLVLGLAATVVLIFIISRKARAKLQSLGVNRT
jgi:uncharacterized membrane protein YdjX (TVP38/TMEM64 family)